jgi:signal transduction histidine kinase
MGVIPEWAVGVAVIVFAVALAQIVVVKLRASVRTLPPPDSESGELRQAVDAMQARLGELEERVDFTERLLAKPREADRLEPPPQ